MKTETDTGWIAVQGHIVGSAGNWDHCYHWNGTAYLAKATAIKRGMKEFGSDDFNLGRVEAGKLVWWGWMDDPLTEDIPSVAASLGLSTRVSGTTPEDPAEKLLAAIFDPSTPTGQAEIERLAATPEDTTDDN